MRVPVPCKGLLPSFSLCSHMTKRNRGAKRSGISSYKGTNPLMGPHPQLKQPALLFNLRLGLLKLATLTEASLRMLLSHRTGTNS